ncbi:MAG: PDZ domain-containing protein [Verrucomicrobia bacterium]|nr:PDZ domain-containing protein [Verrucomicrobiota bacterium]
MAHLPSRRADSPPSDRPARRGGLLGAGWVALALAGTIVLGATPSPAGPPGPWVFIPPPGASSATASAKKTAPSGSASAAPAVEGMDRARLATVVLERNKKPIGLGVLLSEKSVVITARSPVALGGGTGDLEIRFPESNATTKVKLHHEDAAWDLALLVPYSSKWSEGAKPSDVDPLSSTTTFSTFVLLKTGKVQAQATPILGKRDYLSPDGDILKDALSIDTKNVAIGTPLVDPQGGVVGVVGRACAPGTGKTGAPKEVACAPALFGAPIAQIRKFLKTAPPIKAPTTYLGVTGLTDKLGVRVVAVAEGSPAALAGIKANEDAIVAVDGTVTKTAEDLAEQIKKRAPGDETKLTVMRGTQLREVKVVLKSSEEPPPAPTKPAPVGSIILPLPPLPPVFGPKK